MKPVSILYIKKRISRGILLRNKLIFSDAVTHALKGILHIPHKQEDLCNMQANYVLQLMVSPQTASPSFKVCSSYVQ